MYGGVLKCTYIPIGTREDDDDDGVHILASVITFMSQMHFH